MKQSNLLVFLLMSIAAISIGVANIPTADAVGGKKDTSEATNKANSTGVKEKDITGAASGKKENVTTSEQVAGEKDPTGESGDKAQPGEITTGIKASSGGKTDNTTDYTGVAGFVLGIVNIIVLGATLWFNKEAINKIKDKAKNSEQKIDKLKSQYQPLEHQIKKVDSDYQNYSNKTNKEFERLRQSIEELSRKAASVQQSATVPQSNYRSERQSSSTGHYSAAPVNVQLSPTDYYNSHQNDFQNKYQITTVGREAENLNQSRAAQTDSVVLAGDPQGNYWLFSDNAETYLVPKQNLKITDSRLSTTNDLFECQDYNEHNYKNFILIKPAVMTSQGSGTWQLKEKGKLQFG